MRQNSNQSRLLISLLALAGLCMAAGIISFAWITYARTHFVEHAQVSDQMSQTIIQESTDIFVLTDRCDPFPCNDRFQVIAIEHLATPLPMANTGAAKISGPSDVNRSGIKLIESSEYLREQQETKEYICQKDDYLVSIKQRNWFYLPIDSIRICYHITTVNS